jgi:cyanate permease
VKTRDPQSLAPDQLKVQIFMAMGLGFLIASIGQFVSGITIAFLHGWQLTLRLGL